MYPWVHQAFLDRDRGSGLLHAEHIERGVKNRNPGTLLFTYSKSRMLISQTLHFTCSERSRTRFKIMINSIVGGRRGLCISIILFFSLSDKSEWFSPSGTSLLEYGKWEIGFPLSHPLQK